DASSESARSHTEARFGFRFAKAVGSFLSSLRGSPDSLVTIWNWKHKASSGAANTLRLSNPARCHPEGSMHLQSSRLSPHGMFMGCHSEPSGAALARRGRARNLPSREQQIPSGEPTLE